ncbi:MFS transporter [Arenibaculum sp.]|jgi:MFS family permease|uniref:MFS transporter n=1 Tax=Arenibaculum sp. TaxID=2865862 RepID=UPI002E14DD89|nr:MFS transporter [Arenibaculum sp.]
MATPFFMVVAGLAGAGLGVAALKVAFPAAVALGGGSPAEVAAVATALTMGWPLFGILAGVLLDRMRKTDALLLAHALVLLAALAAALVAASVGAGPAAGVLALLCAAGFAVSCGEVLAENVSQTVAPDLVAPAALGRANSLLQGTKTVAMLLLAPLFGAALLEVSVPFAFCAVAAVLAAAALVTLPARRASPRPDRPAGGAASPFAGLRYIGRDRTLLGLTVLVTGMSGCWSAWLSLVVSYAVSPDALDLPASLLGGIMACLGVGSLLGAVAVEPLRRVLGDRPVLFLDLAGTVLLLAVPALSGGVVAVCAAAVAAGFGGVVWVVTVASHLQVAVPRALLGRTVAAYRWIGWTAFPAGSAVAGAIAEAASLQAAFAVFALGSAVLAISFFRLLPADAPLGRSAAGGPA